MMISLQKRVYDTSVFSLFYVTGAILWGSFGLLFLVSLGVVILAVFHRIWNLNRRKKTILYQLWEAQRIYYLYILKNDRSYINRRHLLDILKEVKKGPKRMKWVRNLWARCIRKVKKSTEKERISRKETAKKRNQKTWDEVKKHLDK